MVAMSISLHDEVYKLVAETMEKEKMNRSNAIEFLIKLGYHYKYNILEKAGAEAETGPSRGSRVSEPSEPPS